MTLHACVCTYECTCVRVCVRVCLSPGMRAKLKYRNQPRPIPFSSCIPPCIPHPPQIIKQPLWLSYPIFHTHSDYNLHIYFLVLSNFLCILLSLAVFLSNYSSPSLHTAVQSYLPSPLPWLKTPCQIGLSLSIWTRDSFNKYSRVSALQGWLLNTHTHAHVYTYTSLPRAN